MWYVIQTLSGEEERTADMIEKVLSPNSFKECFVPKRERLMKFYGSWNKVVDILFPGYVFVISESPEKMYEELRCIPRLTKILGRENNYFFALDEKEENLVRGLGDEKHKTTLSKIRVGGERKNIEVIDGPLRGYAGHIVKMNLHKREAVVRVEFMGRPVKLKMGVEMVDVNVRERVEYEFSDNKKK